MVAIQDTTLVSMLVILALGLVIPEMFRRLRIPFISSIILAGAFLGPNLLGYVQPNPVVEFFGFLGMTFLMLMAGLETNLKQLINLRSKISVLVVLNGIIPFATGVVIARLFNFSWMTSFLVGTIFISSSVAVLIPALKSANLFNKRIGRLILSATIILDILSLVLLSFILQEMAPITTLPLHLYFLVIIFSIIALFFIVPSIAKYFFKKNGKKGKYEEKLRFVLVIVIGVLAYFSALGVHPILAAFIVGLTLSHVIRSEKILTKLHTLGYGLFVPVFFFIIGMKMDLKILTQFSLANLLMISIVFGLIFSKLFSGYIAGRIIKLPKKESLFFGSASTIQITTTLAVAYAASEIGILDINLLTSIVMMSVITTIVGPIFLKYISSKQI